MGDQQLRGPEYRCFRLSSALFLFISVPEVVGSHEQDWPPESPGLYPIGTRIFLFGRRSTRQCEDLPPFPPACSYKSIWLSFHIV